MRLQLRNYIWIYSNQLFFCLRIKIQNKFVTYLYTFHFFVNFIILQNTKKNQIYVNSLQYWEWFYYEKEDIMFHRLIQIPQNTNCEIMARARDLSHLQNREAGFAAPPVF